MFFARHRFHAALAESAGNTGHAEEARFHFDRASSTFTVERVLNAKARCLMPGDRYVWRG